MNLWVKETAWLSGSAQVPGSKSHSIRAIFLALLAHGQTTLNNVLEAGDTEQAMHVAKQLGASIMTQGHSLIVVGRGVPLLLETDRVNTGNSGITTHFALPLLGLRHAAAAPIIFDCGEQMRSRPLASFITTLQQLGLGIHYLKQEGRLPVRVSGKLRGGVAAVSGMTSQYLSALLIALPMALQDSELRVQRLMERPYLEMTLAWLNRQSIHYQHEKNGDEDIFKIKGNQVYQPFSATMPGDFSSAASLLAAAVLTQGEVELTGLELHDSQGDKQLLTILTMMGATIHCEDKRIKVGVLSKLKGISIDAKTIPDLLPVLAVLGSQAQGKTVIKHVRHARIKETDRIHSMVQGLRRLGADIKEHDDGLTVYQSNLHGNTIAGFDDHRTVMALSVAGLLAKGSTLISNAEAIAKTFPGFIHTMQTLGAKMAVQHVNA